jgi:flagellar hook-associated protein FlgK
MNVDIALSGLRVAQTAIELAGTNIANASTEGYHRQDLVIGPETGSRAMGVPVGGSRVLGYERTIDTLLESEIRRQQPQLGQVDAELSALQAFEGALGDLGASPLGQAVTKFFSSLTELASQPTSQALREQAIWSAQDLSGQLNRVAATLRELKRGALTQAQAAVEQVNSLSAQIAEQNSQIQSITLRGGQPNLVADQRDQAIAELSRLIDVQVIVRKDASGAADVVAAGTTLVSGSRPARMEAIVDDGELGITREGAASAGGRLHGGRLAGLEALHNDLLDQAQGDLDALAGQIARQINRLHVNGIGAAGSFSVLTGSGIGDTGAALSSLGLGITAGEVRVRLVGSGGDVERYSVAVDPDADSLEDVAARLAALAPAKFAANVVGDKLKLEGRGGWKFDFLGGAELTQDAGWTGTSPAATTGTYTAGQNRTYTLTMVGGGQVGVTEGLSVRVRTAAGEVATLDVGRGYAAGDGLEIGDGLSISFGVGTLVDGQTQTLEATGDSDPSGFLAGAGMNTFFTGRTAADIGVRQDLLEDDRLLATGLGDAGVDNLAIGRMAALRDTPLAELRDATPEDYFRLLVTGNGQKIAIRQARQEAMQKVVQQLESQRDKLSGVDVNDEAAKLMVFEQMFQTMARFLAAQQKVVDGLVELM